jgi:uncharacterized protein (DUF1778 family)
MAHFTLRLDPADKRLVEEAAKIRGVSVADWCRSVLVTAAEQELAAEENKRRKSSCGNGSYSPP